MSRKFLRITGRAPDPDSLASASDESKVCNPGPDSAKNPVSMPDRSEPVCPNCGALILESAPLGLCPKCLLQRVATTIEQETKASRFLGAAEGHRAGSGGWDLDEIRAHFPDLEILELIGMGGMGAVYKARQPKLDRIVGLKVLSPALTADPDFVERFGREARILARLHHPNIVTIFDTGVAGPCAYLIMEFVDGANLRQALQGGGFPPMETLTLMQSACAALEFAHQQGVLHRDIKPENILIDSRGQVKIADFGIAKLVGEQESADPAMTRPNMVLGSPRYMAPEQFESPAEVDERADIYSLGVVLYQMLTGNLPVGRFAPPSVESGLDVRVDEVVGRALERDKTVRFRTMGELRASLEELTAPPAGAGVPADPLAAKAAMCTGLSLVLTLLSTGYFMMMLEQNRDNAIRDGTLYMILAVELVIVGIPGVLGMLFGWRVLGALRGSPEPKPGLDTALVGALPWPLILVFLMVGGTLWSVLDAAGVRSPMPLFLVASLSAGGMLAFLVTRSVIRRVRGEVRANPKKGRT